MKHLILTGNLLVLVSIALDVRAGNTPTAGSQASLAKPRNELDGLWIQQFEPKNPPNPEWEDLQARMKNILLNQGNRSYWLAGSTGVRVNRERLVFPPHSSGHALDLINRDDRGESRCLYEVKGDLFHLYWNVTGKPLRRPSKLAASKMEGTGHWSFKRVPEVRVTTLGVKEGKPFAGLWETVGFEMNGIRHEEEDELKFYWQNMRVYYFDENRYLMFAAINEPITFTRDTFALVPAEGKNAIDFKAGDTTMKARFALQGKHLDLCWNPTSDGPRPNRLATADGDGFCLIRLRRIDLED